MPLRFALLLLTATFLCGACHAAEENKSDTSGKLERGGAELWARNCRRCHNLRAPTSYSADQLEIVVNHMRIRANLTAKDARKIEEFLKAAN